MSEIPAYARGYDGFEGNITSNWTSTGIGLWRGNVDSNGRVQIESVDGTFLRSRDRLDWPRVTRVPDNFQKDS